MSEKQHVSVVFEFVQTLVKPTTFLRLSKLLFKLLVRVDVLWSEKGPAQFATLYVKALYFTSSRILVWHPKSTYFLDKLGESLNSEMMLQLTMSS